MTSETEGCYYNAVVKYRGSSLEMIFVGNAKQSQEKQDISFIDFIFFQFLE